MKPTTKRIICFSIILASLIYAGCDSQPQPAVTIRDSPIVATINDPVTFTAIVLDWAEPPAIGGNRFLGGMGDAACTPDHAGMQSGSARLIKLPIDSRIFFL